MKKSLGFVMLVALVVVVGCNRPNEKIGTDIHNHKLQELCRYYSKQCREGNINMCSLWHMYCQ